MRDEPQPIETIEVPKKQLAELLKQNQDYKEKESVLVDVCKQAMHAIGLIDETTGEMKAEVKEGKVISIILKTVKDKISMSDYMFNKKKFESDLAEQFSFLTPLLKIGNDYANRKQ